MWWSLRRDRVLGGILIGDASAYSTLLQMMQNNIAVPPYAEDLLVPPRKGKATVSMGVDTYSTALKSVRATTSTKGAICTAIQEGNLTDKLISIQVA